MWHFSIRKSFSAYLDAELDEVRIREIEAHLQGCASCRRELENIRQGKVLASHFEFLELAGTKRLWEGVRSQLSATPQKSIQPGFGTRLLQFIHKSRPIFSPTRPAFAVVALTILLFANLIISLKSERSQYRPAAYDWMSNYVFDYGLYLNALAEGRQPKDFEIRYDSHPVNYEVARDSLPFRLVAFSGLPEDYQLTEVRLLKNACCHSVQFMIRKDSKLVVLFQQPKEHPFAFGNYPLERIDIEGYRYHKATAGPYQALWWEGGESKFVAMGKMVEEDMVKIINTVTQ